MGKALTRCWLVAVVLFLAARTLVAAPGDPTDAADLLRRATAAAGKLTAISFEATVEAGGGMAAVYPRMTGKIVAVRGANGAGDKIAIQGTMMNPGSPESATWSYATDGVESYQIDNAMKVFTFGRLAEVGLQFNHPLFPPRYFAEDPFKDVAEAPGVKYEGLRTLDGIEYQVLSIPSRVPMGEASLLYFGKEDYILRRTEMSVMMPPRQSTAPKMGLLVFSLTNLNLQPKVDDAMFRLECPAGYEKKPLAKPSQGEPGVLPAGTDAPDWELKASDGRTVTLKSLRGKVVLLDFWATWCGPCKMAMPGLQKLHEKFKDKPVAVFGVNCRERDQRADPMAYIREKKFTYEQLLKGDATAQAYRVNGIPSLFLIGPDGKILWSGSGFNPQIETMLAQMIENALPKTEPKTEAAKSEPPKTETPGR